MNLKMLNTQQVNQKVQFFECQMEKATFWAIRLSIVSIAGIMALAAILIILKNKLQQRLPMQYTLIIASCHLIMIILTIAFGICSIILEPTYNNDQTTFDDPTLWTLCQIQATLFKSAELISFTIASALMLIIFEALKLREIESQKRLRWACFIIPTFLMILMASLQLNGVCRILSNSFNCVCVRTEYELGYYLNWVLPCGLLTLGNILGIFKINQKVKQAKIKRILRFEHKLVLIIYYLPFFNFFFYSIYLIVVITHRYIEINELIMMCFYHLIYLMPIVNLLVVHTYNKHYQSYLRGDRSQFETMLPNQQNTSGQQSAETNIKSSKHVN